MNLSMDECEYSSCFASLFRLFSCTWSWWWEMKMRWRMTRLRVTVKARPIPRNLISIPRNPHWRDREMPRSDHLTRFTWGGLILSWVIQRHTTSVSIREWTDTERRHWSSCCWVVTETSIYRRRGCVKWSSREEFVLVSGFADWTGISNWSLYI